MKIDQQNIQQNSGTANSQQAGGAQQVSNGRGASASSKSAYSGLGNDSVELSSLSSAVQAYTTGSPERTQALQQIGSDVQAGRYKIDNMAVGQGIIADAMSH